MELSFVPIVIDTSVYKEVVEDGITKNYPDSYIAKKYILDFEIEIIPVDISDDLSLFRDPGETSCYKLANENGICLTSDKKAISKMIKFGQIPISLDEYYYNLCKLNYIEQNEFENTIDKLIRVFASNYERKINFMNKLGERIL